MAKAETFEALRSGLVAALGAQNRFNATSLARAIGRDGTYLRDFIRGKKETIGALEIAAIEQHLGVSLDQVAGRKPASVPASTEVELVPDAPRFEELGGSRNVPVYGISVGGEEGDFSLNGETVEYVNHPRALLGRKIFAIRVKGSSMEPRFDEGDLLYVEQNREPAIGDDGVFEMKPTDEWEAGHAFIKQLVSKGMGGVKVRQFNPPKEISYKRDEIKRMYRVIPRNELLGV